eukprot:2746667-Pleurochrysis_carterae.AAC.1
MRDSLRLKLRDPSLAFEMTRIPRAPARSCLRVRTCARVCANPYARAIACSAKDTRVRACAHAQPHVEGAKLGVL